MTDPQRVVENAQPPDPPGLARRGAHGSADAAGAGAGAAPTGTASPTVAAAVAGPVGSPAAVLPDGLAPEIGTDGGADGAAGTTGSARLPSLTGLRWLAAFMVWGFHLKFVISSSNESLTVFFQAVSNGGMGVSFFFVLSGFVLVWSYRPGDTSRAFLQRRFAKIYPNFAFALICSLIVLAVTGVVIDGWSVLANVLLINSWILRNLAFPTPSTRWPGRSAARRSSTSRFPSCFPVCSAAAPNPCTSGWPWCRSPRSW